MRILPLLPILLFSLATPTFAFAQDNQNGDSENSDSEVERVRTAAEEFDDGRRAFTTGDYAAAAEHFENADRDAPAPPTLRMAIRARMAAKQYDRVATLAASALARYPDDDATVAFAKKMLSKVPARLHRLTIRCDEPCALLVDHKVAPWKESTEALIYVEPGEHEVAAGWSQGRTETKTLTADSGGETDIRFEAPDVPAETETRKTPSGSIDTSPKQVDEAGGLPTGVFYGAVGVTAVLAGVTLWSTLDMRANPGKDKVREDCAGQDESCPTYQDALASQRRTNVLLVTTGIATAGTVLLGGLLTDWSDSTDDENDRDGAIVPTFSVGRGVQVGATGRF